MNVGKMPQRTRDLRAFTDALRGFLGLGPLYRQANDDPVWGSWGAVTEGHGGKRVPRRGGAQ